jgi:DNA-binding NarL/FixJ family response regulator
MNDSKRAPAGNRRLQIQHLAQKGLSKEDIAERLKIKVKTVRSHKTLMAAKVGVPLTPRETEVVELAQRGLTSAAIGNQLGLSERTVEAHRQSALKKHGVNSMAELTARNRETEVDALRAKITELEEIIARQEEQLRQLRSR